MIIFSDYEMPSIEELKENYREYLEANNFTEEEIKIKIEDEYTLYDHYNEELSFQFDCEKDNLDKELHSDIIAIADIGTWRGRRYGYKVLDSNLKCILTCFSNCDCVEFFTKNNNVFGRGSHHDGTNYVQFRKFKEWLTSEQKENFLSMIYEDRLSSSSIGYYTNSIYYDVKKVYG